MAYSFLPIQSSTLLIGWDLNGRMGSACLPSSKLIQCLYSRGPLWIIRMWIFLLFFLNSKTCISLIKHSHHSAGLFCILITFDELLWAALSPFISKTTMPLLYPILFDTCFLRFIITKPKRNRCVFFHVQFSMHPLKCHCNVSRIVLCHSWAKSHVLKEICCLCMCVVWSGVHTVPQTNKKVHSM